jgi:hypothetical protein
VLATLAGGGDAAESAIIWQVRLPRLVLGCAVGAAPALSGATLRNPSPIRPGRRDRRRHSSTVKSELCAQAIVDTTISVVPMGNPALFLTPSCPASAPGICLGWRARARYIRVFSLALGG